MSLKTSVLSCFILLTLIAACGQTTMPVQTQEKHNLPLKKRIKVGAENIGTILSSLKGKRIGLVANHTSKIGKIHVLDFLLSKNINVVKLFSPEHGFRGKADAGEKLSNSKDKKTGLPIISLYGKHRKPTKDDFEDLDVVIFDIQDVGVRFYTYISTMHYVMEACAENNKQCVILDRPNPNGHYVDGPVREDGLSSFVSMHPIPIVHGLTVGELAMMINGQGWLKDNVVCKLQVVKCTNYTHDSIYNLPIKPSPNLPNMRSIYLYPSLCLIEGTNVSVGRGTESQFQIYGHPSFEPTGFSFTPIPNDGSKKPKLQDQLCHGINLNNEPLFYRKDKFQIKYLLDAYRRFQGNKKDFWLKTRMFDLLAGTKQLKKQIIAGKTEAVIRASWQPALQEYKNMRKQYLLYP